MTRHKLWKIGAMILICGQLLSVTGCTQEKARTASAGINESVAKKEAINTNNVNTMMQLSTLPEKYIPNYSYKEETYKPAVEEVPLAEDFSNVINLEQFEGFTQGQLEMLKKKGFVVMQPREEYP